jgi:hypothetical protein
MPTKVATFRNPKTLEEKILNFDYIKGDNKSLNTVTDRNIVDIFRLKHPILEDFKLVNVLEKDA